MQNPELWQKICLFKLDDPNAAMKFSDKLQKEEKWEESFAIQAISEYKKFMYLCVTQPNGASPSEVVDKVWHLHLTYTDNYWNQFCKKVLSKEIHHFPNKGGSTENLRHVNWYKDTIVSYVKEFQEIPSKSFWVIPEGVDFEKYLPVNSPFKSPVYEALPKPFNVAFVKKGALACGIAFLILLVIARGNPYHLTGSQFLAFYFGLMMIGFALIFINKSFKGHIATNLSNQLHPIHYAIVFKNIETALRMLTINFVEKKYLTYENGSFQHVFDRNEPLFYTIQAYENPTISAGNVREIFLSQAKYFSTLTKELTQKITFVSYYFIYFHSAILLIGVIRVFQGHQNHQPIGYLAAMITIYLAAGYYLSQFKVSSKVIVEERFKENATNYDFAIGASLFIFSNYYLLNEMNEIDTAFSAHVPQRTKADGSGCTSSGCGSGGGGDSGGCSSGGDSGCGGCGGD